MPLDPPNSASVFEIQFPGTPTDVSEHLRSVEAVARKRLSHEDPCHDLVIVLGEVLNNIVEHAYAGHAPDKSIQLRLCFEAGRVEVETRDSGASMPDHALPPGAAPSLDVDRAELPEGGFGWFLIQTLARDLTYQRHADENILRFAVPYSQAEVA